MFEEKEECRKIINYDTVLSSKKHRQILETFDEFMERVVVLGSQIDILGSLTENKSVSVEKINVISDLNSELNKYLHLIEV